MEWRVHGVFQFETRLDDGELIKVFASKDKDQIWSLESGKGFTFPNFSRKVGTLFKEGDLAMRVEVSYGVGDSDGSVVVVSFHTNLKFGLMGR